jgi:hypothetical protein
MIRFSALEYIKIDIANQYGLDKKSFKQRIAWVDSIKDLHAKVAYAEKPAQFLAGVLALEDALAGRPSGFLVELDACASGISILGILTGCHVTSSNTGVIGSKRMDMYGECTKAMNAMLPSDVTVPRADAKSATMTHYYGSVATPKRIFGEETNELYAFYKAQELVAPGACFLMQELLSSWQPNALVHSHTLPDGFQARVPVLQKCKAKIEIDELDHSTLTYIYEENIGSEFGLAVAANMVHATDGFLVRETVRRCNYDRARLLEVDCILGHASNKPSNPMILHPIEVSARDHGFLSLRGVEFITENNVLEFSIGYRIELSALIDETLTRPSFPVLTIHDAFKCHPNYVNEMREVYRDILVELADSNVGVQIIREVRNDPTFNYTKASNNLGDEIMKSEYFLS